MTHVEMVPEMDGVYIFNRIAGLQLQPQKRDEFDNAECEKILHAAYTMDRLFANLNRSFAAETALNEFKEQVVKPNSESTFETAEVDRKFRAFIFEWKLFTEHWKNYIFDLDISKYGAQYIEDYKKLYKETMDNAFQNQNFVLAHVIRNYVSHANDAIDSSHIGEENQFWIHKRTLQNFLSRSITRDRSVTKKALHQKQKALIDLCDERIDLMVVADKAMKYLMDMQEQFMNYQLTQEIIDSCIFLLSIKDKIGEEAVGIWEVWKPISDPCWVGKRVQSITLRYMSEAKEMNVQFGRIRLNWIGYWAVASYVVQLANRNTTANNRVHRSALTCPLE